jgi:hypothetical protein
MKWLGVMVFGVAFVTSVLAAGFGCASNECQCTPTPPLPDAQGPLTGLAVSSYDAQGESVVSFVQPENGSFEVTRTEIVLAYEQQGVTHQIIYTVTPTP